MPTTNPEVAERLRQAKEELARLKAEKLLLYPPNPHPLAQPDTFPGNYTPDQIRYRNELVGKIEEFERRVESLQDQLYSK